jgi:hypothetical protein
MLCVVDNAGQRRTLIEYLRSQYCEETAAILISAILAIGPRNISLLDLNSMTLAAR